MKFDMSIEHNFASFSDEETDIVIYVDSFDNYEFDVQIGTIDETEQAGTIFAESSEQLNLELEKIYNRFKEEHK